MTRRPRLFAPGLLYHAIARGNQRQPTFLDDTDYRAYLRRLALYRERYDVTLHAYCLMPNHVHLLAQTGVVPLAKFMQGLQQSYAALTGLETALGFTARAVRGPDRSHDTAQARGLLAFVLVRRRGYRLKDVARLLGRDPATISVILWRIGQRLGTDQGLSRAVEHLENCLEIKV